MADDPPRCPPFGIPENMFLIYRWERIWVREVMRMGEANPSYQQPSPPAPLGHRPKNGQQEGRFFHQASAAMRQLLAVFHDLRLRQT